MSGSKKAFDINLEDDEFGSDDELYFEEIGPREVQEDEEDSEDDGFELIRGKGDTTALSKLTRTYLREIYDILGSRKEVNYKNALEINMEMQSRLIAVRTGIQSLNTKIVERYATNEKFLKENMKIKKPTDGVYGKISRGEKFFFKGSIFFRDKDKRNAPNNEDYFSRHKSGEMFPMDFELTSRHVWSITDKMSIVKAIKEQILTDKKFRKRFKNKNQKLGPMLKQVDKAFEIDWVQISAHDLRHRHTPTSCKAMFEVYLHPSLKHDAFKSDENERLAQAVEKHSLQNWTAIAAEVGQRSDYQCFLQYHTSPAFRQRYDRWDKKDDDLLIKTVEASKCNGVVNWAQVAFLFPQKSKVSLQQRYKYVLDPVISHEAFTGEEDLLLLAAVQEYGPSFSKFPRSLFPNRSIIQLRARYMNTLQHRHKLCPWTIEDDKILIKFVQEHGMAWKKCSDVMEQRHSRVGCRQRYLIIKKNMDNNPNFKLEDLPRRPHRMISTSVTAENWLEKIELLRANPDLSVDETTAPIKKQRPRKRPIKTEDDEPAPKRPKDAKKPIYLERLRNNGILYHNFLKYGYNFRFGKPIQYTPLDLYMQDSQSAIERLGFHVSNNTDLRFSKQKIGSNVNGLHMPPDRHIRLTNVIRGRVPSGMVLEPNGNQVTPNFSTLTALRALCVLSADTAKRKDQLQQQNQEEKKKNTKKIIKEEVNQIEVKLEKEVSSEIQIKEEFEEMPSTSKAEAPKKTFSDEYFNSLPVVNRFRQRFRALFYQAAVLSRLPPESIPSSSFAAAAKPNLDFDEEVNSIHKPQHVQKLLELTASETTTAANTEISGCIDESMCQHISTSPKTTSTGVIKQEPNLNAEINEFSILPILPVMIKSEFDLEAAIDADV